jgi:hypothetical protein
MGKLHLNSLAAFFTGLGYFFASRLYAAVLET